MAVGWIRWTDGCDENERLESGEIITDAVTETGERIASFVEIYSLMNMRSADENKGYLMVFYSVNNLCLT